VQTHPDVLIIPPDPPQMMIKVDQVRRVIETIYFRPGDARERVYIFTDSNFMKEAANSLLKVLEEPPEFATIFLLTENVGELLPTIRSRAMTFTLSALPVEEVEADLAKQHLAVYLNGGWPVPVDSAQIERLWPVRVGRRATETAFTGGEGVYEPRYASQRGALKPFEASAGSDFEVLVRHKSGYHPSSRGSARVWPRARQEAVLPGPPSTR